ncbi:MAG: hypothetical protein R6U98_37450, partial [Pirellulaceae bacterium]
GYRARDRKRHQGRRDACARWMLGTTTLMTDSPLRDAGPESRVGKLACWSGMHGTGGSSERSP